MLSRTADNLYWLSRYVERAEYLARTIEATLRVTALPNTYIGQTNEWDSALLTAGVEDGFYDIYDEANEKNVVEFLALVALATTASGQWFGVDRLLCATWRLIRGPKKIEE